MKKFTLLTVFTVVALGFSASAQIQKGNVLIGSDLTDLSLGLNTPNAFSLNISPKAAWFIKDNVALGGYANFGLQTQKGSGTATSYGVGALGRYYTGSDVSILNHGRLFGEATVGFGGASAGGKNTNGLDLGVGPGFAYFVTPSIGLETLLKYNGLAGFGNQSYQSLLTLNFGLQVYLPGKSTARKIKNDIR